jgi:hypothetical protein
MVAPCPELASKQAKPGFEDIYWGDPASSSLRWEGQSAYRRSATDVHLVGHAWASGGKPARAVGVELRLGTLLQKRALALGERRWEACGKELVPSATEPFVSLPLRYEWCFGGSMSEGASELTAQVCQRNPVGRGVYRSAAAALGNPLPNIEEPSQRIQSWSDRPKVAGFGPIARHWAPRAGYVGTYDDAWRKQRAPYWPKDFDERFFCAAAAGMSIAEPRGGELVTVRGTSPEGEFRFALPKTHLEVTCSSSRRTERARLALDGIHIDTDERVLTLSWRAAIRSPQGASAWKQCNVEATS